MNKKLGVYNNPKQYQKAKMYQKIYNSTFGVSRLQPHGSTVPLNAMSMSGSSWGEEETKDTDNSNPATPDLNIESARAVIQNVLKSDIVPFLWGPPGVGKSTLVKEIAKENNWELIDLRLSLLNPVDLRGLPVTDKDNKQADWYPPSFLPKENDPRTGILFLDEINLAPLSVQAAAYQLILDKRVGEYKFPKHWKIVAAGNRETDRANVVRLSAPLANRFLHLTIQPDFQTWGKWAKNSGIRQEIIAFLVMRPNLLFKMPTDNQKGFPTPRSWDFASQMMNAFDYKGDMQLCPGLEQVVIGAVGEGVGQEFLKFLSNYNLQEVGRRVEDFINSGKLEFPKNISERYAFCTAVINAHEAGKISEKSYQTFLGKLNGEERSTVLKIEHEKLMGGNKKFTILLSPISSHESTFEVEDVKFFNQEGGHAELMTTTSKEIVIYSGVNKSKNRLVGVVRGQLNSTPQDFAQGTIIRPL